MLFSLLNSRTRPLERIGEAGLNSLMRDSRYTDGHHAEHDAMVNLVRRGFQLVFDEPEEMGEGKGPFSKDRSLLGPLNRRTLLTGANRERPFSDAAKRLGGTPSVIETLGRNEHEALGRKIVLSALNSVRATFPSGFTDELGLIPNQRPSTRRETGTAQSPGRQSDSLPVKDSGMDRREKVSPIRGRPQETNDGCESLRREKEVRSQEFHAIMTNIDGLQDERQALLKERREEMPSMNDEDRLAGRKRGFEFSDPREIEKDTPDAQRRRGGRPPRVGIDLAGRREEMIRHRDTAQKRVQRAKEIDARLKEIEALLNTLDIQREKVGRELADAELRNQNCRIEKRWREPASK